MVPSVTSAQSACADVKQSARTARAMNFFMMFSWIKLIEMRCTNVIAVQLRLEVAFLLGFKLFLFVANSGKKLLALRSCVGLRDVQLPGFSFTSPKLVRRENLLCMQMLVML